MSGLNGFQRTNCAECGAAGLVWEPASDVSGVAGAFVSELVGMGIDVAGMSIWRCPQCYEMGFLTSASSVWL